MIYPEFLKKKATIGIAAPSAGVGRKLESFDTSLSVLKEEGYRIKETKHVRTNNPRGGNAETRGRELTSLFLDPEVDFVMCAAGGDFLNEMIPYTDFETMQKHPKWLMGFSDPTGVLYPYTTLYDVATIYGMNAGDYDVEPLPEYAKKNLELIRGRKIVQKSYPKYMKTLPWEAEKGRFDAKVKWVSTVGNLNVSGRCIGGCIDGLKDLIGTPFDGTKQFLQRYQEDGFIWYFDNFGLSAENLYRTLTQMRYAGWFENAKAVIVGRTLLESSETGMKYPWAIEHALKDIPVLYNADIGHTLPHMTMINGAMMDLKFRNQEATVRFRLD